MSHRPISKNDLLVAGVVLVGLLVTLASFAWFGSHRTSDNDPRAASFIAILSAATAIEVVGYSENEPAPKVVSITGSSLTDMKRSAAIYYVRDFTGSGLMRPPIAEMRIRQENKVVSDFTWFGDSIVVTDGTSQHFMRIEKRFSKAIQRALYPEQD